MNIINQEVSLLWATPDIEKSVEAAGRTCYKSESSITDESAAIFCEKMVKSGHHAMIEFGVACFRIITDKGITHEIVRHRLASYAQESTRWVNYADGRFEGDISFVMPKGLDPDQEYIWKQSCKEAESSYFELIESGCKPQQARDVLPHSLKTEIVMMMNVRELRHFISLRAAKDAHPKIQELARAILAIMYSLAPSLYEDQVHLMGNRSINKI